MNLVDVSNVTLPLFVTCVVFLLLVAGSFSLGVLRCFQQRVKQGIIYFVISVISLIAMIYVLSTFFEA